MGLSQYPTTVYIGKPVLTPFWMTRMAHGSLVPHMNGATVSAARPWSIPTFWPQLPHDVKITPLAGRGMLGVISAPPARWIRAGYPVEVDQPLAKTDPSVTYVWPIWRIYEALRRMTGTRAADVWKLPVARGHAP